MTTQHPSDQNHPSLSDPAAAGPVPASPAARASWPRASSSPARPRSAPAGPTGRWGGGSSAASVAASAASGAIQAAEIPVGGGRVFEALKVVVTQPTSGDFKAFSAVCTHQACTVAEVANGVITCPCHGSQYDIATGEVRKGPATKALPPKSVSVGTDGLTVS